MEPTHEKLKEYLIQLDAQHPSPWIQGATYDAINPANGKPCKIRRSRSVRDNIPFLHIYTPCTVVLKTPGGEVLEHNPGWRHYRANLRTYTLIEL